MKILLAPDKFKDSIDAKGVCDAIAKGLKETCPKANVIARPLADGGEGSLIILEQYLDLEPYSLMVQDPIGRIIEACYRIANKKAYIELSSASGLALLSVDERNCMHTSTYGTGQLMLDAYKNGVNEIYLFIGGSATNDGGIGIANALGYEFYDAAGRRLKPIGESLLSIDKIDKSPLKFNLEELSITVICDVHNPFYGKHGAAYIYAAQKGASADEIIQLDNGLRNLANRFIEMNLPNIVDIPGAGAAGGVGGGAIAMLNANIKSGIQTFLEITQLEKEVQTCDLIITGEGKMDGQTEQGKVVSGVSALAKKYDKPVIGVCGISELSDFNNLGLEKIYTVMSRSDSLEDAMENVGGKLVDIGREIGMGI